MHLSPLIFLLSLLPTTNATPTTKPLSLITKPQDPSPSIHKTHLTTPSYPHNTLSKRAHATYLTGGWTFTLATASAFTNIHSAATALNDFYRFAIDSLYDPENAAVDTRALSISDETFELLFRVRDRWIYPDARVQIFMVRQFVTLMRYRAQRGLAAQFKGWLRGPGGVVVDVVMETIPAAMLLDSAMDIYGDP
ncbi:MAG: hypothetical protein L6R42_002244 [Xanthoria sp. 1 TBL-2021]|nr:MAG: hypothetical protein L6R42_002244 [Xanthoria sp. 1 TBL-2021]